MTDLRKQELEDSIYYAVENALDIKHHLRREFENLNDMLEDDITEEEEAFVQKTFDEEVKEQMKHL